MHAVTRQTKLTPSAQRVPVGHSFSLAWEVTTTTAAVASVQLTRQGETGLEMIEALPDRGSRLMIFTRPGRFTFTLTAVFEDGVKHTRQVLIRVEA